MISITHFRASTADFATRAQDALAALADRPGFVRGTLGRSTDDEDDWLLLTEWKNVGSYRRALGNYDVKVRATPLLGEALDVPSSFESLVDVAAGGDTVRHVSDREPEA
jgi:heme oxygenase (mycobilin-producing)